MKVMTAMYTMKKGGAYDRFIMMVEAFLERGVEVHCLSLTPIRIDHSSFHNHKMYFPFKKVDGLIARIVVLSLFPPWALWLGWRNRIDLFIAFGSLYAFIQGLSKWCLKRPMVTLIRGNLTFGSKMQNSTKCFLYIIKSIENIGLRFSNQIITNNESSRNEILNGLTKKKDIDVQVLYNNIPTMNIREPEDISNTRERYGIPRDRKILVTAGILNRGKNIETLIECLKTMKIKNICLLIAGDGSTKADFHYRAFLQKLAKTLEVDKQVIFTGWLEKEDLWKIYHASDLFIMPSLNEGMPNAMLEALGMNLPCIGSDIPGIRDILQYEDLMFDPLEEEKLTQKIESFFSGEGFLNYITQLCQERKKVLSFDWKGRAYKMITKKSSTFSVSSATKD